MSTDWRKSMLAKIHVAKKQLGLTDEEYRDAIEGRFGVRSAGKLNMRQLDQLLINLQDLGFKERTVRVRKNDKAAPSEQTISRKAMLSKIEALLSEIGSQQGKHVPWDYAAAILKRMYKVDRLDWAKSDQLRGVIAALHRKAYGATPESIAENLLTTRQNDLENYEFMRGVILSGVGARTRAKAELIVNTRLALNESSMPPCAIKQKGSFV